MNSLLQTTTINNNTLLPYDTFSDEYLQTNTFYDTMSPENLKFLVERTQMEIKRKELLSQHTSPIKQLPNGRWYTRIKGRKVERKTKKEIENLIIQAFEEKNITLNTIFDNYLTRRKMNVADTTWAKDIRYFENFLKDSPISDIPLQKLTLDDGYSFLDYCLQKKPTLKRRYWNNLIGFLNNMFQYAMDRNIINDNPFRNLKPKKDLFAAATKTRDGDTVFTKAEQTKICSLAEADAEKTAKAEPLGIIILFNLGIRDGELCALKWSDIEENHHGKYIHIQREMVTNIEENGKSHGFKVLPHCKTPAGDRRLQLNKKAIETFEKIKEYNKANGISTHDDDYIFLRMQKGNQLLCTPRSFDPRLRKYCKQANMSVIKSPHDVRRTVLTNLYMAHMPLKKIQEYAGHSSLKQTMDYIRITDDDMDMLQYLNTLSETIEDNIVPFCKRA